MSAAFQPPRAAEALIDVVPYEEKYRQLWDDFVAQSNQGTLFHTRAFLAYHPPDRFTDASLLFFKRAELLAVFPAANLRVEATELLRSHPGASFGGLVTTLDMTMRELEHLIGQLLAYSRSQKYSAIELTLPPYIYFSQASQKLEFLLYRAGFRYHQRELTHFLDLRSFNQNFSENFSAEFNRKIRRARQLGVTVRECDDFTLFYHILEKNLQDKHKTSPVHTLKELFDLKQRLPERVRLFAAYVQDKMIAGILLFICNAQAALAFYISQLAEYQQYRPVNLLCYETAQWCAEQELAYFDFGTSTLRGEINWGLVDFRQAAGAQAAFRDRMRLDL